MQTYSELCSAWTGFVLQDLFYGLLPAGLCLEQLLDAVVSWLWTGWMVLMVAAPSQQYKNPLPISWSELHLPHTALWLSGESQISPEKIAQTWLLLLKQLIQPAACSKGPAAMEGWKTVCRGAKRSGMCTGSSQPLRGGLWPFSYHMSKMQPACQSVSDHHISVGYKHV